MRPLQTIRDELEDAALRWAMGTPGAEADLSRLARELLEHHRGQPVPELLELQAFAPTVPSLAPLDPLAGREPSAA